MFIEIRCFSDDVKMTPVGFEPTQLALVELESTPLDHSGKVSWQHGLDKPWPGCANWFHVFLFQSVLMIISIMYTNHAYTNGPTRA